MENEERKEAQQEGIEVIIRIKPRTQESADEDFRKCVFMSPTEENTIVVETQNKKEFFSFDHIASEESQQDQIYDSIGQPVLEESFKGFNCCIFAYGQTGAGKTYSILGNPTDIVEDHYSESRGILPRLLQELFLMVRRGQYRSCDVRCSYLQIYNQQIIDLLNKDIKTYQIRQDHKRGVYVQGLSEEPITNYEGALEIILKGLKNRKIAATSMNSESSRSHTIFSIALTVELEENGLQKSRFSKIHVVDLAGSERTKLAKVEGDRLKQGCNINKSLHALGNVINSLVESAKKKKYIPFRDSKLTFFLKDSLGGNSKTKLLANINPCKAYLGDTISTLMFAKRAKIIKVRVQANQNIADNFQSLRNEIRKLREQLAQTKFIKNDPKPLELDDTHTYREKPVDFSVTDLDQAQEKILKTFEENQNHYRMLITMYQQRIGKASNDKGDYGFKTMFEQKKSLEKSCNSYSALLTNFPAFTRIFKDNLELKKKLKSEQSTISQLTSHQSEIQLQLQTLRNNNKFLKSELQQLGSQNSNLREQVQQLLSTITTLKKHPAPQAPNSHKKNHSHNILSLHQQQHVLRSPAAHKSTHLAIPALDLGDSRMRLHTIAGQKGALTRRDELRQIANRQNEMLQQYEQYIEELKQGMTVQMQELCESYVQLERELETERSYKHSLRRQQNKKKDLPPQLQTLENQNQYLKLNVMELETEVSKLEEESFKKQIELKTLQEQVDKLKKEIDRLDRINDQNGVKQEEWVEVVIKLKELRDSAEKEQKQVEEERDRIQAEFKELKATLLNKIKQNYELAGRCESLAGSNASLKKKLTEMIKLQSQQSVIIAKESACWTTLQEENLSEEFGLEKTINQDMAREFDKLVAQKDSLLTRFEQEQTRVQDQRAKLQKASNRILALTKQLTKAKQDSKHDSQQLRRVQLRIQQLQQSQKKLSQKCVVLQCDCRALKKQLQQSQHLSQRTRQQFGRQPLQMIQQFKLLRARNQILNHQNQRLRNAAPTSHPNSNTKSFKYLSTVTELATTTPRMNQTQKLEFSSKQERHTTVTKKEEVKKRESMGTAGSSSGLKRTTSDFKASAMLRSTKEKLQKLK